MVSKTTKLRHPVRYSFHLAYLSHNGRMIWYIRLQNSTNSTYVIAVPVHVKGRDAGTLVEGREVTGGPQMVSNHGGRSGSGTTAPVIPQTPKSQWWVRSWSLCVRDILMNIKQESTIETSRSTSSPHLCRERCPLHPHYFHTSFNKSCIWYWYFQIQHYKQKFTWISTCGLCTCWLLNPVLRGYHIEPTLLVASLVILCSRGLAFTNRL